MSISLVAAAALSLAASPESPNDTARFSFQRSELAAAGGPAAVYARMKKSADNACEGDRLRTQRFFNQCKARLLDDWVKASGDPRLQQLHDDSI